MAKIQLDDLTIKGRVFCSYKLLPGYQLAISVCIHFSTESQIITFSFGYAGGPKRYYCEHFQKWNKLKMGFLTSSEVQQLS